MKIFPQNPRSFPGALVRKYIILLSVFQGVFQGPGRKLRNSRSFPGIPGVVSAMTTITNKEISTVHSGVQPK